MALLLKPASSLVPRPSTAKRLHLSYSYTVGSESGYEINQLVP